MTLKQNNIAVSTEIIKKSKENLYYNMDVLERKLVPRSRYVSKTDYVHESVPVTRTVPVTKTRMVTTHGPGGTMSTRTETYTDFETRTTFESRWVPKTSWVWETIYESVLNIPIYDYYEFSINDKTNILIYRIEKEGQINYYFQNPTYYSVIEKEKGFFGDKLIKLLIIDVNSNGIYFEDEDKIFFNSWNPYEQNSKFTEISNFMDNYWYRFRDLKIEKFLSFSSNSSINELKIMNSNSIYIDIDKLGEFKVINMPKKCEIFLNGKSYFHGLNSVFKGKIEYGFYNLKIIQDKHLDFKSNFVIDDKNLKIEIEYKDPGMAGVLEFDNDFIKNWTMITKDETGNENIYFNEKKINLAPGNYQLKIIYSGFVLEKKIIIQEDKTTKIDYKDEIEKLVK